MVEVQLNRFGKSWLNYKKKVWGEQENTGYRYRPLDIRLAVGQKKAQRMLGLTSMS
ncbi:hypothetical protein [Photobacterium gaetbulicola]|uniref:hypothetical protein n=1 Tax=Photobacterium gaetbulicola TaxID=1295392 RepID=UPI0012E0610C|nr:hypothetical protein [Photobacterium gaetbulicola]